MDTLKRGATHLPFIPHLALRVRSPALIPKTRDLSPPLPVSSAGREQAQAAVNAQEWVMGEN
jgi:hypothetical protein